MGKQKVSISDVARKAEVSSMTVSRVVRGEPSVKEATRRKVIGIMKELGYVPSAAAQSLRSSDRLRQSGNRLFALIFGRGTESSVNFFHDITRGVEKAAGEHGLCPIQVSMEENPEKAWLRLQTVFSIGRLGGALLVGQFSAADIAFIRENVRSVVVIDGPAPNDKGIGSVESGNLEGALLALDHLIDIGCRRLLIITVGRENYFARAMEQAANIRRSEAVRIEVRYDCWSGREARELILGLWSRGQIYDGIFTTDDFALGALRAFRELQVPVPGAVRIIGFDDIVYSSLSSPSLSSIHIDKWLLGAEAVRTLVALAQSPDRVTDIKKIIRPSLIIRESTGAAKP